MSAAFVIQRLDGYTDGRPSWAKVSQKRTREEAQAEVVTLHKARPGLKLRIHKRQRR